MPNPASLCSLAIGAHSRSRPPVLQRAMGPGLGDLSVRVWLRMLCCLADDAPMKLRGDVPSSREARCNTRQASRQRSQDVGQVLAVGCAHTARLVVRDRVRGLCPHFASARMAALALARSGADAAEAPADAAADVVDALADCHVARAAAAETRGEAAAGRAAHAGFGAAPRNGARRASLRPNSVTHGLRIACPKLGCSSGRRVAAMGGGIQPD